MYLAAGNLFRAKAGTGAANINYAIFTDEVAAGADNFAPTAAGVLGTSIATLYTATASTQSLITEIQLANTSVSAVASVQFFLTSTALGVTNHQLNGGFTIPAGGSAVYTKKNEWQIFNSAGALITTVSITAAEVPYTPAGTVAATNVQDAITELDTEKVPTTRQVNGHALSADVAVTKSDVGLGNADNTSDVNKPVSTAQLTALDAKLDDSQLDTDGALTANSDSKIPSQKAVVTYVATQLNDFDIKLAVRAASQGNLAFTRSGNIYTATSLGVLLKATIDSGWSTGAVLAVGDRILLANQTSNIDNGLVTITNLGAIGTNAVLTRSTDADVSAEITSEMRVPVSEGTDANTDYKLSAPGPFTLNTTALPFTRAGGPPTGSAGGDLSGTYPNPVVASIQGFPVDTTDPINGQVLQYVSASGKYVPLSYGGDVGGGPSASVVNAIKSIPVVAGASPGQEFQYFPSIASWQAVDQFFNILAFGADASGASDSSLAIFNATICCGIQKGAANQVITSAQVATNTTFNISVPANSLPSTGTLMAQTTLGLIGFTYTGGGTGTLAATTTYGITGGLLLAGSIIGVPSTTSIGGVVFTPSGFFLTNYQVINSIPGIQYISVGANNNHDTGSWPLGGGGWWSYRGTAGGACLVNVPISGSNGIQGGQVLGGIKVMDMNFHCSGTNGYAQAGYGVLMISCNGYHMENLYVFNASKSAYEFTTLGAAMLGEAADCTRGTHVNLKFRQLEAKSGTAATVTSSGLTNPAATTNLNALSNSTVTVSGAPNANWDTAGLAKFQAIDALTGTVCWYLVSYTGISGSTLTGCNAVAQFPNQANSTTLNANTPASGNAKPNATMFAGSKVVPAQGAFGEGLTWHGSATANACCSTFIQIQGTYWQGTALYSGNSDSQTIIRPMFNRTTAGTPTGIGVELHGSTLAGAAGAAGSSRNQLFIGGDPGLGGFVVRGTDTLGYLQPASTNKWEYYELGNGAPIPVSGTGAHLIWTANGGLAVGLQNGSTASATGAAGATGLIVGTNFPVPPQGVQTGLTLEWEIPISKTAAGTALSIAIKFGTGNSAADGNVALMTLTSSAAVDSGVLHIKLIVVTIGGAATAVATSYMTNRVGTTTGFSTTVAPLNLVQMAMTAFNSGLTNPGPAWFGAYVTTNTAGVLTFLAPNFANVLKAANP